MNNKKRLAKEFKTQNLGVNLCDVANKFAEENNYSIISMSTYTISEHIFTDGRKCSNWRYLTVLYESNDNLF